MSFNQVPTSHTKSRITILLLLALLLGIRGITLRGSAQTSPRAQSTRALWREMDDRIPAHLPLKVEIKNLQNEHWVRDLEVEVTNKSSKPIYYLKLSVSMPGVKIGNGDAGHMLRYGRPELIEFDQPILHEDVPIKPGETIVLKFPENVWQGWEDYAAKHNLEPIKRVKVMFHALNFGDGTGFAGTMGTPIPNRRALSELQEQKKSM